MGMTAPVWPETNSTSSSPDSYEQNAKDVGTQIAVVAGAAFATVLEVSIGTAMAVGINRHARQEAARLDKENKALRVI
jgi:hypothetical protein